MSTTSSIRSYLSACWTYLLFRYSAIFHSGLPLFFWIRPQWTIDEIPDQTGRVVIVTGGNSGTGYATCKTLYEAGATVYMACRSQKRALKAIDGIKQGATYGLTGIVYPDTVSEKKPLLEEEETKKEGKGRLEFLELDLADLDSIKRCVESFQRREQRLDVLYANAGVMASPEGLRTKQGYTLQFGTNCLGHQYLISLLLPLLARTSKSNPSSLPRVIISSSAGHAAAPSCGVNFRSVVPDSSPSSATVESGDSTPTSPHFWERSSTGTLDNMDNDEQKENEGKRGQYELMKWIEYGQSKWGDIALARWIHWAFGPNEGRRKESVDVADDLKEAVVNASIISIPLHPGMVATNLAQHLFLTRYIIRYTPWLAPLITRSSQHGALNQIWAGTCPEAEARRLSGEYIVPFANIGRARPDLDDRDRVQGVWKWCEEQTKRI